MATARNIAVVVRDRQSEAMRMALGLILIDDRVDVFLLAGKLGRSPQDAVQGSTNVARDTTPGMEEVEARLEQRPRMSEATAQNLELMKEMGITVYSSDKENVDAEYLPAEEIARRLLQYDHILPY